MSALRPGLRVRVYRNLRKPGWFSIVADEGTLRGRVIAYARTVHMSGVVFKVSVAGRERTLRAGRRRVHAWAIGLLVFASVEPAMVPADFRPATYRPFQSAEFFDLVTGAAVHVADSAILTQNRLFYRL